MFEVIFLWGLALVWIIFATIQDIRKREIADWLNYSLIIFALAFRLFCCFFGQEGFSFFYQGLIGFGIFFVLGNIFYYSRLFAGGDSKLLYGLGAVLPIYGTTVLNLKIFLYFLVLFLIVGSLYGFVGSIVLGVKNRAKVVKEFKEQFRKNKILFYCLLVFSIILLFLGFVNVYFAYFGIFVFAFNYLIIYAKAVDEGCMVRKVNSSQLTEGDWLHEDVKVGKNLVKATWNGLEKKDIGLLRKFKKEVLIRYGIQFAHVFLISFVIVIILHFCKIWF